MLPFRLLYHCHNYQFFPDLCPSYLALQYLQLRHVVHLHWFHLSFHPFHMNAHFLLFIEYYRQVIEYWCFLSFYLYLSFLSTTSFSLSISTVSRIEPIAAILRRIYGPYSTKYDNKSKNKLLNLPVQMPPIVSKYMVGVTCYTKGTKCRQPLRDSRPIAQL